MPEPVGAHGQVAVGGVVHEPAVERDAEAGEPGPNVAGPPEFRGDQNAEKRDQHDRGQGGVTEVHRQVGESFEVQQAENEQVDSQVSNDRPEAVDANPAQPCHLPRRMVR